nr:MAG TPA: hypothetical protein [Caudoviricetes sp.]DAN46573.1 MAG TPA: hypothetical protein [Caudoviricetes sp.]
MCYGVGHYFLGYLSLRSLVARKGKYAKLGLGIS